MALKEGPRQGGIDRERHRVIAAPDQVVTDRSVQPAHAEGQQHAKHSEIHIELTGLGHCHGRDVIVRVVQAVGAAELIAEDPGIDLRVEDGPRHEAFTVQVNVSPGARLE